MRPFLSIKRKLLVFILCISLIPIIVILVAYYFSARNTLVYHTLEELKGLAESKRLHFLSLMEAKEARVIDFSMDGLIRNIFETIVREGISKQSEVVSLHRYLVKNKFPLCRQLIAIILLDKQGKVIASTSEKLFDEGISLTGIIRNAIYVDQPHYFSYFDKNCICISAPIISEYTTEPLGTIVCIYSLAILNEIITSHAGMRETGEVYLVNREKIMLTESRFIDNASLKLIVDTEPVRQIIRGKKEYVGIYRDYRGILVVGAALDIPEYGWILLTEIDKAEALASLKVLGFIILIIGVVGVAAVTSVGTIFVVSTSKPIKDLTDATEKFARGELDARVNVVHNDELGILATSFNTMAEELAGKIAEHRRMEKELRILNESLEQLVKDRTAALVRANKELQGEIAERKRAEEGLRYAEAELRNIMDSISDYLWSAEVNKEGQTVYRYYSPVVEKITGRPPEFYMQGPERWLSTIYYDDRTRLEKASIRIITGRSDHEEEDYRIVLPDGTIRWVRDSVVAKKDKKGILRIHGVVSDITDRKQVEERLKKYEVLFSEIRDLAYICDTKGNIVFVNKILGILTGHKPEEFFGKPFAPLFDEENLKKAMDAYARTLQGESPQFELSFKDTGRVCEYENFPIRDGKGNIIGIGGIARDITEQRRMEEALRKSEASLANAQRIAHVGNWEWDIDKNRIHWSDEVYRIFGLSPQTFVPTYEAFLNAVHPDDREYVKKSIHEAVYEGKPFVIDHRILLLDGTLRFAHCQGEVIYNTTGRAILMNGTIQDVTELKKIEEELRIFNESLERRVAERTAELVKVNEKLQKEIAEHKLADESLLESEERYRSLVENAQDVIYTLTADGTITSLNPAFEAVTGWSRAEWLYKQFIPLVHPDDRSIALKLLHRAQQREIPPTFELRILSRSGDYAIGEFKVTLQIQKGSVIEILGIARDITERKRAEEALRASESKYRLLLENLPQRIFHKDKDLVYVSCNRNLARDLHIKPSVITGKTDYDFFPRELAEKYRIEDKRVMELGQTDDREEEYIRDGQELIVRMVRTPIKDEKGNIIGILGAFLDITEKITLQREAERSRHLAALGELAAGVGHEINNPITGVINCAQILLNKSSEGSKERDIAGRIIKEANRIANITSSLLSFARLSDKKERKSIVSIHEIMANTLVLTEAQLRKECITMKLDISPKLPQIVAHPQQIQQVFLNAISNARYALNQKYPGAHDNKILEILGEETTIDNRPSVKITFYDHGTGIPARIRDKVTEPFYTTKPRGKGTGLGLSISYGIIKDHDGRLMIDSVEGEFTKIIIVLPAFKPVSTT